MSIELLCTLGPASLNRKVINRLEKLGASLFRINLSHTPLEAVADTIDAIREHTDVSICLDTEGAQVRTGSFADGAVELHENMIVECPAAPVSGTAEHFNLTPLDIIGELAVGDFISIDFNSALAQVVAVDDGAARLRVLNGGMVGSNKAVTVQRDISMPPLSKKDQAAISIGREKGVRHFALSFANHGSDVDEIRRLAGQDAFIISKIESRSGLAHLADIATKSDAILIDRGDLSRQVPIERIPAAQKMIIATAKKLDRRVYVATNLLESMVTQPAPTRAEVNDIYNTLLDGASGLVLAAETAIGAYPIRCASMVMKMTRQFEAGETIDDPLDMPVSLLVDPHGGELVERTLAYGEEPDTGGLTRVTVSDNALMDCELIANGTYSPLTGFMDKATLQSVLHENRLPSGDIWTLPILLHLSADEAKATGKGQRLVLCSRRGTPHAFLDVAEVFSVDMPSTLKAFFGTESQEHPGARNMAAHGNHFVAGDITLFEPLPSAYRHYELTPRQARFVFAHKGWSQVIGFHTRNPAHRGHEWVQKDALSQTSADGLYINPVIGPKKPGDFLPEPIMLSYQTLLAGGFYPSDRVVLGSFPTYSRYAGPREAVFTAICRKNLGCSHFIIGRDHTGVGNFYDPDANRRLFEELGDIGIDPIFFDAIGYNAETDDYEPMDNSPDIKAISGTQVRDSLRDGTLLPDWMMRECVQKALIQLHRDGHELFVD